MGINFGPPADGDEPASGDGKIVIKGSGGELAAILKQIRKDKGDFVVVRGTDIPDVARIPTGVFEFDLATGGGFPCSRYSIVYGPEGSCKTNLCFDAIATAQRLPPPCNKAVFVDLEGTFDPKWAAQFGVDTDELLVVKPGYGEEAVDLVDAIIHADDVAILVVDSLALLVAAKEIDGSVEKADVGTSAILVKRLVNKLAIAFAMEARRGHTPCVILINQTRFKIGVMFGDPETIPGGQAMKFNSSLSIRVYGKNKVDTKIHPDLPVFKSITMVIKKSKIPVRATKTEFDLALMLTEKFGVGQSASFGAVKNHLQTIGAIASVKGGYDVLGTFYSKVGDIENHYYSDPVFQQKLQRVVMDSLEGQKILVEPEGAVK